MVFEKLIEKHKIGYEIACLRYQKNKRYKEIARQFNLSDYNVREKHKKFLYDVLDFYIKSLKKMHIEIDKWELYDFYYSFFLTVAYLEKTYSAHLQFLRHGKPPIIPENHVEFPPFRTLTEENILEYEKYILEAIEQHKKKYSDIGQELDLSKEKVVHIYNNYYHKKIRIALDRIRPTVGSSIDEYIYGSSYRSYKRWQLIVNEYPKLVQDLID